MINKLKEMKKYGFGLLMFTMFSGAVSAQELDSQYGNTPEEIEECKKNLSLYREYRDQKLADQALPFWREAFRICPQSAKTLYTDGAKFYGDILDEVSKDSTRLVERNAYIDTLMMVYDKRIEHFGEEGKVLGMKANDMFKYDPARAKDANALMKRSLELEGNESDAVAASKYYETLYRMYLNKEATKSDLLVEYIPVLDILDYNIAKLEDENLRSRYEKAKTNLDAFFIKIAECDDINNILKERIAESPNDITLNKKALAVLNKRDCTDGPLYLEVAERVYRDKPTAPAAYSFGIQKLKAKDYGEAGRYFEEAIQLCGDCIELDQYYLRAGQTATIQGNSQKAIGYANKILNIKPKSGEAYILKGDAIASGAKACEGEKLKSAGAYLLAVDYYNKARSVDPSVADKAGQKAAGYQKYFPILNDVFFVGLAVGDSYKVECFGENTTIRTAP